MCGEWGADVKLKNNIGLCEKIYIQNELFDFMSHVLFCKQIALHRELMIRVYRNSQHIFRYI